MSVTHHYDSNRESAKNLVPPIKKILKGILIQELQIFYTKVKVPYVSIKLLLLLKRFIYK